MTGEIALGGVYVPTLLLLALVALILAWAVTRLIGALGLYRFLAYRAAVDLSLFVLILGGLAIDAGGLVNGGTIARETLDRLPEMVTCCHVETEAHEAIRENAALADTCLDHRSRPTFGNDDA